MYNLKALSFVLLLLLTEAFASRITYTTGYTTGGVSNKGGTEQKAGGKIADDKDDDVIKNIGKWSGNEFTAKQNARTKIIIVSRAQKVKTKKEAVDSNNEAQQLVNKNIKD